MVNSNLTKFYKKDFEARIKKIYLPKVEFLINNLKLDKKKLDVLDIGCGTGLFNSALSQLKIKSRGLDVSKELIQMGKTKLGIKNIFRDNTLIVLE